MFTLLLSQIPPVTLTERIIGCSLGVIAVLASIFLLVRQWLPGIVQESVAGITEPANRETPWRTPVAFLLGITGALVFAGVWIDPNQRKNEFLVLWLVIMLLVMGILLTAGMDLLVVRWRARQQRRQLIEEYRRDLRFELDEKRRGNQTGKK